MKNTQSKIKYEKIIPNQTSSLKVLHIQQKKFDAPLHFHEEIEITWIIKGQGNRFVGDSIESFEENDLLILGNSLPHCWINHKNQIEDCKAIVLQFRQDFMGTEIWQKPEFQSLSLFFTNIRKGLQFLGNTKKLRDLILEVKNNEGLKRLFSLFILLQEMQNWETKKTLASEGFTQYHPQKTQLKRIEETFSYLHKHFKEEIKLEDLADKLHMSKSAFCHFFKNNTGKTFSTMLNEMRLAYACRLLIESDKNIAQIAYESGYQNLSYFNKVFRTKYKMSPRAYKNM